jgi:hypothetical protein
MDMLYYFTASDKDAKEHFKDTIENPYYIYPLLTDLSKEDNDIIKILEENDSLENVHTWGALPGSSNTDRWHRLEDGDKVLAYSEGTFLFYGTVFAKTHNSAVAKQIWGTNSKNQTWEYIYFIKDLKPINIDRRKFASFFNYKLNFIPQGFSNVRKDKHYRDIRTLMK